MSRTDSQAGSAGSSSAPKGKVTRDDIQAKFSELQKDLTTAAAGARSKVVVIGGVAVVVVLGLVYVLGRRSGRKRSTVVEIRRL